MHAFVFIDESSAVSGDGLTPETAFHTFPEALDAIAPGGMIVVVTHGEPIQCDHAQAFTVVGLCSQTDGGAGLQGRHA